MSDEMAYAAAGRALVPFGDEDPELFEWHPCEDTPACHALAGNPCACSGMPWPSKAVRAAVDAALAEARSALASIESASGRTWRDAIEALRDRERTAKYGVHRAVAKQAADYLTATEGRG